MAYVIKPKVARENRKKKKEKDVDKKITWFRYGYWIDMMRNHSELKRFFSKGNGIVIGISQAGLIPAIALANMYQVQFMALIKNKKSEFELVEDVEHIKEYNKLMKQKEFNVLLVTALVDRGNTLNKAVEFLNENGVYKKKIELLTLSLAAFDDDLTKHYPDLVMRKLPERKWIHFPYEENV